MRIVIFSVGTQGDVRPFVALGRGLQGEGHDVCIASGATCAALVQRHGLEFAPLTADFLEAMARDPRVLEKSWNPLRFMRTGRRLLAEMAADWLHQGMAAAEGAELLLGNGMMAPLAAALAEKRGIVSLETQLQPVTPCPDIPPMMLRPPRAPLPGKVNLMLYGALRVLTWQMLSGAYTPLRAGLGLPAIPWRGPYHLRDARAHRVLYGFSPTLLPPSPHWPATVRVVGNWFLDEEAAWSPPPGLDAFLAQEPKPIYVGFGSMLTGKTEEFTATILEGIKRGGRPAVVATGWGGIGAELADREDIYMLDAAPHDWLFPRVAMAIHHGGVGTTAAALRAGVPSVVVPFFGDQPFWGWRLQQLGVAPAPLPRKRLSAAVLARAIGAALEDNVVQRAQDLGRQMGEEDGVADALAQLREWGVIPQQKAIAQLIA